MPVLDTQLWLATEATTATLPEFVDPDAHKIQRESNHQKIIVYKFFKKSMASKTNNLYRGACHLAAKLPQGHKK